MTASRWCAERYPEVAEALDRLAPCGARLTGTGACVFVASADPQAAAEQLAEQLPRQWNGFVARGLAARRVGSGLR